MTQQVRSALWIPPARPEWVSRVNAEGKNIDLAGVIPLDERSLIDTAVRNTGLDDFGDEEWREPFRIFITALEEEAQLNLMGRLMTRSDLLTMLEARLQIEETYKRHPGIEEEEIVRPLLIIGHARTGTSALQYLLATDPENGTTKTWEVVFPCPPPRAETYLTDPRIERELGLLLSVRKTWLEVAAVEKSTPPLGAEDTRLSDAHPGGARCVSRCLFHLDPS